MPDQNSPTQRFRFYRAGEFELSVADLADRQQFIAEQRRARPWNLRGERRQALKWAYERDLRPVTDAGEIERLLKRYRSVLQPPGEHPATAVAAERSAKAPPAACAVLMDDPSSETRAAHRESQAPDQALRVFRCSHNSVRITLVDDPGAQGESAPGRRLFCPGGLFLLATAAPHTLPGYQRLDRPRQTGTAIAAYRRWQEDERAEHARQEAVRIAAETRARFGRARSAAAGALRAGYAPMRPLFAYLPTADDVELAVSWMENEHRQTVRADLRQHPDLFTTGSPDGAWGESLRDVIGKAAYDLERTLSARMAEKFVIALLEAEDPVLKPETQPRRRLIDMSGRQVSGEGAYVSHYDIAYPEGLKDPESGRDVPPRYLDVKNARGEGWRPYRDHLIQKGREEYTATPITFVGTYSTAVEFSLPLTGPQQPHGVLMYLGEISAPELVAIEGEYQLSHGSPLKVSLGDPAHPGKLSVPPWMFDLPHHFRRGLDDAIRELRKAAKDLPPDVPSDLPATLSLAAGLPLTAGTRYPDGSWRGEFLRLVAPAGLALRSLPRLYLAILDHFFRTTRRPANERAGFDPAWYRELLFGDTPAPDPAIEPAVQGARACPLGVPDPLRTIHALIGTLERMVASGMERLAEFTEFDFRAAGELYGLKGATGKWWTLLFPYCGATGKDRDHFSQALEFGANPHCGTCRRLICTHPGCFHCTGERMKNGRIHSACTENRRTIDERRRRGTLVS